MHVLVTGANGHLGYNLCKELLRRGHKVRDSVRSLTDTAKSAPLKALGDIELVAVDLYKPEQLRAALDGIEVFFHLAAVYAFVVTPGREEEEVIRPSLEGAENAIRTAADVNASNARIKRELGWKQSISLEDSLRDTMAALKENRARLAA